ncbi:MAG: peptidylprolyl isomerase [Rhodospirillales bacterium]|nr:peptidylprolyl isomerase [Rhodospirillales bacterium]
MSETGQETIQENKYVELAYRVIDQKSGDVLVAVEFPIGYIHGANDILTPAVGKELLGKSAGDVIEVPLDCDEIYGPRDESLVFTDKIENVPEQYREVGTTLHTENEKGETQSFIVTRLDDETLTVDGNNPLCGRQVMFKLEVLGVRDPTEEEFEAGGPVSEGPDIHEALTVPLQ